MACTGYSLLVVAVLGTLCGFFLCGLAVLYVLGTKPSVRPDAP